MPRYWGRWAILLGLAIPLTLFCVFLALISESITKQGNPITFSGLLDYVMLNLPAWVFRYEVIAVAIWAAIGKGTGASRAMATGSLILILSLAHGPTTGLTSIPWKHGLSVNPRYSHLVPFIALSVSFVVALFWHRSKYADKTTTTQTETETAAEATAPTTEQTAWPSPKFSIADLLILTFMAAIFFAVRRTALSLAPDVATDRLACIWEGRLHDAADALFLSIAAAACVYFTLFTHVSVLRLCLLLALLAVASTLATNLFSDEVHDWGLDSIHEKSGFLLVRLILHTIGWAGTIVMLLIIRSCGPRTQADNV